MNGRPVTVSILRELGVNLVNIHGQHDTQTLFDEQTHLGYLDLVCGDNDLNTAYVEAYANYRNIHQQVQRLTMDEGARIRQVETLRYQIDEINRAELHSGEDLELEARRRVLQNAERLADGLACAATALYGNDDTDGVEGLLAQAQRELSRLGSIDLRFEKMAQTLTELRFAAQDVADEVRAEMDDLSYSGDELERIESRLDILQRLRKKYGVTVDDVIAFAENARAELDEIEISDTKLEQLRAALSDAEKCAREKALALRKERKKAADALRKRIEEELAQLDMPNICFCAEFEETDLTETGMDFVRFLMSANAGEALKPMSKVASGGELARIMLAMKNVLAEKDQVSTLIFDEVDAGISGRAAQKVAAKLQTVSKGKQVFCVTHLPQIAAMADTHLLIAKAVRDGRTYTSVEALDKEGRVSELARIIGGATITENTRKSAEDMLKM